VITFALFSIVILLLYISANTNKLDRDVELKKADAIIKTESWMKSLHAKLNSIDYRLEQIDNHITADNPAGEKSADARRRRNLESLYSQYLVDNLKLTKEQADARSAFEFSEFDEDRLIAAINGDWRGSLEALFKWNKTVRQQFFATGLLEQDCLAAAKKLDPHDVYAPVWELFENQKFPRYSGTKSVVSLSTVGIFDEQGNLLPDTYADYVKLRAIVLKLIDLDIAKKVENKSSSNNYWFALPIFEFVISDLERIKTIIFEGKDKPDDDYFAQRLDKSQYFRIFQERTMV